MARRIELTVSEETWERLEAARGHEPRASYVKRAVDAFMDRDAHTKLVQDGPGWPADRPAGGVSVPRAFDDIEVHKRVARDYERAKQQKPSIRDTWAR